MTFFLTSLFVPAFFLFGSVVLTACSTAFLRLGKYKSKEFFKTGSSSLFFFLPVLKKFFPKQEWENLYFSLSLTKHIFQLAYAVSAFFYLVANIKDLHSLLGSPSPQDLPYLLAVGGSIIALSLILDYLTRLLASLWSKPTLRIASPFASIILIILFPIVGTLLHLTRGLLRKVPMEEEAAEQLTDKSKFREMINESDLHQLLDPSDQKLISSFVSFKERVAKEIMVPRVDLFALPAEMTIEQATGQFAAEGFSRIPIYKESLDQIIGVVLYKDLLKCYTSEGCTPSSALEVIAKPVLYAPENKKIAHLLQEFRSQQIHMAIIVDEYGGTEGIVTIEDILEELVGEIEDEYDLQEDRQFWELPDGGWVVDAKMTLHDIEENLGIQIPASPEYETIGGYVIQCASRIPTKGWRLSHDAFKLEILSSNERSINKIKIIPRPSV
jgi:CBS domain containing-hemolysin-like protein